MWSHLAHTVFVVLTQFAFGVFDVAPLLLPGKAEIIAGSHRHIWSGLEFGLGRRFKGEPGKAPDVEYSYRISHILSQNMLCLGVHSSPSQEVWLKK